ncbi:hypothetical protein ACJJTC_007902 [Scirpophaga incertulas]
MLTVQHNQLQPAGTPQRLDLLRKIKCRPNGNKVRCPNSPASRPAETKANKERIFSPSKACVVCGWIRVGFERRDTQSSSYVTIPMDIFERTNGMGCLSMKFVEPYETQAIPPDMTPNQDASDAIQEPQMAAPEENYFRIGAFRE